jgi:peroxin-6
MLKAVTRQAGKVDAKIQALNAEAEAEGKKQTISTANFFDHHATPEDVAVMVTEEDFMDAHKELIPSVSAGELSHYERVRATFEGGREANGAAGANAEKQRPVPLNLSQRTVSTASQRSARGKGKSLAAGKGKGKAVAAGSDGEDAEYEDDYGIDAREVEEDGPNGVSTKSKGKGKAVAGFQDGTASDDEGLYD